MAYKNKVSLRVCGRNMTLAGNESVEYMTKVANYIEDKASELRNSPASKNLSPQMISVLTSINIADDYYKQLEANEKLKALLPAGFDINKAEKGMLFSGKDIDKLKTELVYVKNELALSTGREKELKNKLAGFSENKAEMEESKKTETRLEEELANANNRIAELEKMLADAESRAVALEKENEKKDLEISRLKEYEELFEDETKDENGKDEKNTDEVFENQMEISEEDEKPVAPAVNKEKETEFPLHEEGEKAGKHTEGHAHKAHSGNKNYYRQI